MLKKLMLASALVIPGALAHADSVQIGMLTCSISNGIGAIIYSKKNVDCDFRREGRPTEYYVGDIEKLGLDIGITGQAVAHWLVLQGVDGSDTRGVLQGQYVGGAANASFGLGLGVNALVGGSQNSLALQPLSVQGQTGLNATLALAEMELRYVGSGASRVHRVIVK